MSTPTMLPRNHWHEFHGGIYCVDDIRRKHRGFWFSGGAMRFFRSRVGQQVYCGPGGVFFVSSEQGPSGVRAYSVRSYDPVEDDIDTVGKFNAYSRSVAHRMARQAALSPSPSEGGAR